jgi:dipeptidyl aminopeptidase/acylaminoacyl peptidase
MWGVADVEDCINLARYLSDAGHVDPDRLIIRGSSAGGYATLAALALYDTFDAGACYYGVADVEALAKLTHKFEAHYLDSLIGPAADLYRQRSPVNHREGFNSPLILFQGTEDPVVPPEQAQQMVRALKDKGLPYAYLEFPGESHGFKKQSTVVRALSAELYFYSQIFGYELEEAVEPIVIHNLKVS